MKNLRIGFDNENGERIEQEYDTIMDFLDLMESDDIDVPMMNYQNVSAVFWESPLQHKHFNTIEDLYYYCKINYCKIIIQ